MPDKRQTMQNTTRVLGVDTSLRSSGIAVVEARGTTLSAIEYGNVRIPQKRPLSECLGRIHEEITACLDRTSPDAIAIEGIFYSKSVKTAIILGEARGAVIAACASRSLPVFEYEPRRVKQAVVGHGQASKEQVRRMIMSLLGISEEPQEDAGDALAIAVCHLNRRSQHEILAPKQI
jgi:crossover junction endodeoxyribonuclease RuvC